MGGTAPRTISYVVLFFREESSNLSEGYASYTYTIFISLYIAKHLSLLEGKGKVECKVKLLFIILSPVSSSQSRPASWAYETAWTVSQAREGHAGTVLVLCT